MTEIRSFPAVLAAGEKATINLRGNQPCEVVLRFAGGCLGYVDLLDEGINAGFGF